MAVNTTSITANNRKELRERLAQFLVQLVGSGFSWTDGRFNPWTGLTVVGLKGDWDRHVWTTSCNSFAQKVAINALGVPFKYGGLTGCGMDLSGADREVAGSWVWNDASAREKHLHPLPGDFYCSSKVINGWLQKFAHVGIVTKCDSWDSPWQWVAGGQGKPPTDDWVRPGPGPADAVKTFAAASAMVPGWVDIGKYLFPNEDPATDRPAPPYRPYAFMPTGI